MASAIIEYTQDGEQKNVNLASDISISDVSYGENASGQKVLRFVLTFTYPTRTLLTISCCSSL